MSKNIKARQYVGIIIISSAVFEENVEVLS